MLTRLAHRHCSVSIVEYRGPNSATAVPLLPLVERREAAAAAGRPLPPPITASPSAASISDDEDEDEIEESEDGEDNAGQIAVQAPVRGTAQAAASVARPAAIAAAAAVSVRRPAAAASSTASAPPATVTAFTPAASSTSFVSPIAFNSPKITTSAAAQSVRAPVAESQRRDLVVAQSNARRTQSSDDEDDDEDNNAGLANDSRGQQQQQPAEPEIEVDESSPEFARVCALLNEALNGSDNDDDDGSDEESDCSGRPANGEKSVQLDLSGEGLGDDGVSALCHLLLHPKVRFDILCRSMLGSLLHRSENTPIENNCSSIGAGVVLLIDSIRRRIDV
jgi:hypothetical protein